MELLKPIENYENLYAISNKGRVFSYNSNRYLKCVVRNGYYFVNLCKNRKIQQKAIHRLVASAFVENPRNCPCVNHIDGDKSNNDSSNLEWVTHSENTRHAIKHGLRKDSNMRGRTGKANPLSKKIFQYGKDGILIKEWNSVSDASRYIGCKPSTIINVAMHRLKSCKGYIWSYDNPISNEELNFFTSHKANKPVTQYDLNMNFIKRFPSTIAVQKELGYSSCTISQCCLGNTKTSHGYIWRYSD